ncbi:MAG TPA: efflux transporter outer membrane subunit, partial [Novosphingobium sp.]|nr:efflux transporter outer membrane subunit [Novosphingobium sp.]
ARRPALAALALGTLLAGCTAGPDYHREVPPAPAAWHASLPPAEAHATTDALRPDWWNLYGDPVLSALVSDVARANLDLKIASVRFQQSTAERTIARAARLPQVNLDASYARERASPNGVMSLLGTSVNQSSGTIASGQNGFGPVGLTSTTSQSQAFDLPQYGVSASWEVDLWGHVRREMEVANANLRAAEDDRRAVLVSLMAEAAQDYIALRAVQAQLALTRDHLALARRSVALTGLRRAEGAASKLDEAEANGLLHGYEARLPALEDEETHLVNALSFLVGREPGALRAQLASPRAIPPVPAQLPVGLPSDLARRRPDVRAAEEKLHAATASIGVAVAEFYPRLTLSGSLDMQALQWGDLASWSSRQYGMGPAISFPLFQGGRLKGQVRLRRAQQKEAAITLQRTLLKAWQEIDDAMADLASAQRARERLEAAVGENRVALDVAQKQYAQGAGDFLHVLTMQNALLASQSAEVNASANVSTAAARLYRALGGGWEATYPEAAGSPRPKAG